MQACADDMKGCIAIVRRGMPPGGVPSGVSCSFVTKAERCMRAGAIGMILVNSDDKKLAPTGDGDHVTVCWPLSVPESV